MADAQIIPASSSRPASLRRRIICSFFLAIFPVVWIVALELTTTIDYAIVEKEPGLFVLGVFLLLGIPVIFLVLLIVAVVKIFRARFLEAGATLIGCAAGVACLLYLSLDKQYWKFSRYQSQYQAVLDSDRSAPPRFRVFDWGNRGGSFGSTITFEAVVYDESGEIMRPVGFQSKEWKGHQFNFAPEVRWVIEPHCGRRVKALGGHFYYVANSLPEECAP